MKSLYFHVGDTGVQVHPSILLLFCYLLYQGWNLNLPAWHITTACAILLSSVFIHEFGHVVAFRLLLGIRSRVCLFAIGGVAIPLENEWMCHGWKMALVAFAGPFANFLLAGLSLVLVASSRDLVTLQLAFTWVIINLSLGVFNLIPARPFDGGHLFGETVEWALWRTPLLAVFIVRALGILCGFSLIAGTVYLHDPMLALGGTVAIFANSPLSRR